MVNALWRFILTIIFLVSLAIVLAIIWDVPKYLGYELPADFSKLPSTLLILLAGITGIWGTWSRPSTPTRRVEATPVHTSQGDVFATPNSELRHEDLSMVEKANQTSSIK